MNRTSQFGLKRHPRDCYTLLTFESNEVWHNLSPFDIARIAEDRFQIQKITTDITFTRRLGNYRMQACLDGKNIGIAIENI